MSNPFLIIETKYQFRNYGLEMLKNRQKEQLSFCLQLLIISVSFRVSILRKINVRGILPFNK